MSAQGQHFAHWDHRQVGDERTDAAVRNLLRELFHTGALSTYRARLYRQGEIRALRQALCIDLGHPLAGETSGKRIRCLWLVEDASRKVFLCASAQPPAVSNIGGQAMRDRSVLDPDSPWYQRIATVAAARVLGLSEAATQPEDAEPNARLGILSQVGRAILRSAVVEFMKGLDPEVLAAIKAEGSATLEAYNHYWNSDGTRNRNRVQAALAFPQFAEPIRRDRRLRQAVADGRPLTPVLAARYQVLPRTIQRTRALAPGWIPAELQPSLLRRLDQLPPEYLPRTDEDWKTFAELAEPIADLAATLETSFPRLAAAFARGWSQGRHALSAKLGGDFDVSAIYELMQATYRYGVYPTLVAEMRAKGGAGTVPVDPPAGFFPVWFGRYGLTRLAEMAGIWQRTYRELSLERLGLQDPAVAANLSWTGLLPTSAAHARGAYRIVELTSRQALELEGREQRHCVASYAVKCLMGESSIYSIRDRQTGKVISTFEVGLTNDRPVLLRHHGYENQRPSPDVQALAERFVDTVLATIPTAQTASVRQARRATGARLSGVLPPPDTQEQPLSDREKTVLAGKVAFAHPAEVQRTGLPAFTQSHPICRMVLS